MYPGADPAVGRAGLKPLLIFIGMKEMEEGL
jgi:hypothetical protein